MMKRGTDRGHFLRSAWALLALWAAYAALRLAVQPWLGWYPPTADDWTRLIEVRALLDGQSWWDVTQYRINPPDGFSMHWSRLVDLPLALAIALLGEDWGMALVPLLWLLPALFALRAIMLRLGFSRAAYIFGLVLLPLFPLLPGTFAPFAIDHHGPQAVLGLACAALLLSDSRWGAAGAGLFAAVWVVISLEGLPMVAVLAGLYGLRYLGEERRLLPWFLLSLTLCATLLSLATRPNAELLGSFCDILLPGHIAAFAVATLVAGMVPFLPYQHSVAGRLAGLGLIALRKPAGGAGRAWPLRCQSDGRARSGAGDLVARLYRRRPAVLEPAALGRRHADLDSGADCRRASGWRGAAAGLPMAWACAGCCSCSMRWRPGPIRCC